MPESYHHYATMLKDEARIRLWDAAIRCAVKPGDVVVEIGTGVGTFACFAARAGAAKVYAIEADRVIDVAREVAAGEGLSDRIEFIEGYSTSVAIPETADVVVYEDFSPFFFDTDMAGILADARRRFLKPGGTVVPRGASIHVAPFEHEEMYGEAVDALGGEGDEMYGLGFAPLRELAVNALAYHEFTHGDLLAEPFTAQRFDLQRATPEPFRARHHFTAARAGTAHGLAVWFDLDLADGVALSNGPGTAVTSWQQSVLPFERPVPLDAGQTLEVEVRSVVSKFYGCYCNWTVRRSQGSNSPPLLFRHSSFRGEPLPEGLARYLRLESLPVPSVSVACEL